MRFLYQARTKEGELKSGTIEASSKEVALELLQKLDYYVTYLEEEKPSLLIREVRFFQRISLKEKFIFFRQLAIMLASQISIVEALLTVAQQTTNSEFKKIILNLQKEVDAGNSLSNALSKYPKIFSPLHVAMVKSGETLGKLSQSLENLADLLERQYNTSSKLKGAMIYPALVFIVFLVISGIMIFSILPSFEEIFKEREMEIPLLTRIVLSAGKFLRENLLILLVIFLIIFFLVFYYARTKEGKRFFDKLSLKIPFFNQIVKQSIISRFSETLSSLIEAGVMITQALDIGKEIVGNEIYKELVSKINKGIKRGESISSTTLLYPEFFPPLFNQMVMVGEKTGTLAKSLLKISNFYRAETEKAIENLLKMLEPLLVLILGILVGGLMMTVFLPLYRIIGSY
jgi:type IV pilus assembly protein PilC